MNILYCGDENIIDGLIISILSILKYNKDEIHFYVFTMKYKNKEKEYVSISEDKIEKLDKVVKKTNKKSFIKLMDITDTVNECPPSANATTRFTPYCMLRLYLDKLEEIPNKILYLDNDVVALGNIRELYDINIEKYDFAGVLDFYGSRLFKKALRRKDYLNSGVLLINKMNILKNKTFDKARKKCNKKIMLLPDQTALNLSTRKKLILPSKYNEQNSIHDNTLLRHFTTTFKLWPTIHTQTIKPWHIEAMHEVLGMHVIDDVLEEYKKVKETM